MRFSQRYGYKPIKDALQIDGMDSDLRNSLWNLLELHYLPTLWNAQRNRRTEPLLRLWMNFFKSPIDTINTYRYRNMEVIRKFFFECQWYEVYDFLEFIAQDLRNSGQASVFQIGANGFLEKEVSGYRFVDGLITPITDPSEIGAIEEALNAGTDSVSTQLQKALEFLSDRQNPDYRNSIKESISAVETQVRATLGTDKGTLGALLTKLEQQHPIHPAMKEAFSKLYGYTSDEGGIRHALMDDSREATFEEAKFMLVACSAFINYVRGISAS